MKVEEFGLGFPPRVFGKKIGDTLFSLNAIPVGGFVKIFGDGSRDTTQEGSFVSKSVYSRMAVVIAGVVMNLLVAWLLLVIVFVIGISTYIAPANDRHVDNMVDTELFVGRVIEDSAADKAGLMAGDRIITLRSDESLIKPGEIRDYALFIKQEEGNIIQVDYERDGEKRRTQIEVKKMHSGEQGIIGELFAERGTIQYSLPEATWVSLLEIGHLTVLVIDGLGDLAGDLFTEGEISEDVSGPIGIVRSATSIQDLGLEYYLMFIALISLNFAILNILPIPALDGGRLLFLIVEAIKGSPVNQRMEKYVHIAGFCLLIVWIVIIAIHDIRNPIA